MSSTRRSYPPQVSDLDIQWANRNSEEAHQAALEESKANHKLVYETAIRARQIYEAQQQALKLHQIAKQEEERVRAEEARVREETRLREVENRARQIPKVPERIPTPPPPSPPAQQVLSPPTSTPDPVSQPVSQPATISIPTTQPTNPFAQKPAQPANPFVKAPSSNPFSAPQQSATNVFGGQQTSEPRPFSAQPPTAQASAAPRAQAQKHNFLLKGADRYVEIHRALKEMRKTIRQACESDKNFKSTVGDLRRGIRMRCGQIVKDKTQNKGAMSKIIELLESSAKISSPGVDPSIFMITKPEPCEGAINNDEQMPMLILFLLNIFSKYIISQFINEAGVDPEMADPIGVVAMQVFARKIFLWRGESLTDIFMAKMRVSCPVLWGIRGSEKTEQGRASLGWIKADKKDSTSGYIGEDQHTTRMTGLAAGYAAMSLRDFSKTALKNPWVPTHYWQSMAAIVATPPSERSITQYLVLRSMIDGFEQTFLKFYGNVALGALKVALIDYPLGASGPDSAVDPGSGAVGGVKVLADKLAKMGASLA